MRAQINMIKEMLMPIHNDAFWRELRDGVAQKAEMDEEGKAKLDQLIATWRAKRAAPEAVLFGDGLAQVLTQEALYTLRLTHSQVTVLSSVYWSTVTKMADGIIHLKDGNTQVIFESSQPGRIRSLIAVCRREIQDSESQKEETR